MKHGNWVPISKGLVNYLPFDRPYSKVEAAYSLQVDLDAGKKISVNGYAKLWIWGRGKVGRFLKEMGVSIKYSPQKTANQGGHAMIHAADMLALKNGHARAIDSNWLHNKADMLEIKNGHAADMRQYTTKDTNPKKEKNTAKNDVFAENEDDFFLSKKGRKLSGKKLELFKEFWTAFDYKRGRAEAIDPWLDLNPSPTEVKIIVQGAKREALARDELRRKGQTPKMAQGWLSGRRWEDEEQTAGPVPDCSMCDYKINGYCAKTVPCKNFVPST